MRLIDADALKESLNNKKVVDRFNTIQLIDNAPTVERPTGRWFLLDECSNEGVYCSNCHKKVYRVEYANQKVKSNFCPNCGANMRGDINEIEVSHRD